MRLRIADAAASAYGRLGYHATRVEDVLEAAGISRPTFYRFFESLDAAIDFVVENANADLTAKVAAALSYEGPVGARVEAAIDAYIAWGLELGPLAKRLYEELHDPASPAGRHRAGMHRDAVERLVALNAAFGRAPVDPLVFQTLLRVCEDVASPLFAAGAPAPAALARRRAVLCRVVFATLADPEDRAVPPLPGPVERSATHARRDRIPKKAP